MAMILVRTLLQGKFGTGGQLAAEMKEENTKLAKELGLQGRWRILTDLSGGFDRVIFEVAVESLAEWERQRAALFSHPSFGEMMQRTAGMIEGGATEFFTIEGEG
jgi:MOSC domain-containing protein YiiM